MFCSHSTSHKGDWILTTDSLPALSCSLIVQHEQSNERSWRRRFIISPSQELYRDRLCVHSYIWLPLFPLCLLLLVNLEHVRCICVVCIVNVSCCVCIIYLFHTQSFCFCSFFLVCHENGNDVLLLNRLVLKL